MHFKNAPFLKIPTQKIDIQKRTTADGISYLKSTVSLEPHPFRMTERLLHWAKNQPDRIFLGQKDAHGEWQCINYRDTLKQVRHISQWLLVQDVSADRPVAIVAENSIEHALMALGALHIGLPFSTINPAYVTKSTDFSKFGYAIDRLTPGVIMVSDGNLFEQALCKVPHQARIVYVKNKPQGKFDTYPFSVVAQTAAGPEVDQAFSRISPDTIAKVLFTSGSTGRPKGVINTHGNITTNWQQIVQVFPFMKDGFELIDWLPWNHTFGGNHNLGLTLYNGGSLYIDRGSPSPEGIKVTVENLRERRPTIYFNVPKGFEELIPYLRADAALRERFFSRLRLLFYAGAGMAQHIWDALEELAFLTTGKRLLIATGLGCTEASPSAMFNTHFGSFAGMLGVPVPGLELKLAPVAGKVEARYKGGNITPGYWRDPKATARAFDEEGFYKTGDALKFVDPENPNEGMIFDGRIAEDFKLSTGTWVSAGSLRNRFIEAGGGLIQDVVLTGRDQDFIGAIIFPEAGFLKDSLEIRETDPRKLSRHPMLLEAVREKLLEFSKLSKGSSTLIRKALIAPFRLSPEMGELTDKGSINQRAVLDNRAEYIQMIYSGNPNELVIDLMAH